MAEPSGVTETTEPKENPKKALSPEDRRMHITLALLALAVMIDVLASVSLFH